jgi:hypothetical protein
MLARWKLNGQVVSRSSLCADGHTHSNGEERGNRREKRD